jgi:putrescine transport system ATP-binding protein
VRPEKITVCRAKPAGASNVIEGEVWDIGYLGDWTVYRVRLDGGAILRASVANASRFVERPIDWEERVYLAFAPDAAIILTR